MAHLTAPAPPREIVGPQPGLWVKMGFSAHFSMDEEGTVGWIAGVLWHWRKHSLACLGAHKCLSGLCNDTRNDVCFDYLSSKRQITRDCAPGNLWLESNVDPKNSQSDARSTSTPVEGSSRSTTSGSPIKANASLTSHCVKETKGQGHNSRKEPDPKLIETSCPRCATVSLRLIYYRHYH